MSVSVDPDKILQNLASDLGQHYLLRLCQIFWVNIKLSIKHKKWGYLKSTYISLVITLEQTSIRCVINTSILKQKFFFICNRGVKTDNLRVAAVFLV